jgi:large subunit ribosomal protein L17
MAKNLITALFLNGRIVTTIAKAKEYRPMAEKLITLAKEKTVHRMRQANASLGSRPAVQKLFDEIGPAFVDRPGGYTRIVKLARPRLGDKGTRVYFELVNFVPPAPDVPSEDSKSKRAPQEEAAEV